MVSRAKSTGRMTEIHIERQKRVATSIIEAPMRADSLAFTQHSNLPPSFLIHDLKLKTLRFPRGPRCGVMDYRRARSPLKAHVALRYKSLAKQ